MTRHETRAPEAQQGTHCAIQCSSQLAGNNLPQPSSTNNMFAMGSYGTLKPKAKDPIILLAVAVGLGDPPGESSWMSFFFACCLGASARLCSVPWRDQTNLETVLNRTVRILGVHQGYIRLILGLYSWRDQRGPARTPFRKLPTASIYTKGCSHP